MHQVIEQIEAEDLMARSSDPAAQERMTYAQDTLRNELSSVT